MPFPKKEKLEVAILRSLRASGGEISLKEIYPKVAEFFPQISKDELDRKLNRGEKAWEVTIRFAKLSLVKRGEVESVRRGFLRITDKGKERLGGEKP